MTVVKAHMATDPVCGMTVDVHAGKPIYDHRGHTYYFCSEGCRTKFAKAPGRFLDKTGEPEPLPQGTLYTCPDAPRDRPGGTWPLPDLRHGARADGRAGRGRA